MVAQASWYGPAKTTNNEAELAALLGALEWASDNLALGDLGEELLVLGDS